MMSRLLLALLVSQASLVTAQPGELADADRSQIMQAIQRWEQAWEDKDADLAARDYSDDADWTNAFGMRRIGRERIEELLSEVFELPFVMAGTTTYEYHDFTTIERATVLVRSRAIRAGQQLPDGTTERPRRTNHLRVFSKSGERWAIVSHLISDERTPGRPRDE